MRGKIQDTLVTGVSGKTVSTNQMNLHEILVLNNASCGERSRVWSTPLPARDSVVPDLGFPGLAATVTFLRAAEKAELW